MERLKHLMQAIDDWQQVTVLGFVLQGRSDLSERIVDSTLAQFPVIGEEIRDEVEASRLRGSGLALGVGLGLALWGGLGVAEAAQNAMNGIWNVPRRRYPNFFLRRLRGLAWLVILGGGLLLASVVSGFAAAADTAWSGPAGVAASTVVNMLLFLVGFRVLTVRNVSLRSLLPGAVLAALAWALLQWLGGRPSGGRRLRPGSRGPGPGRPRRRPRPSRRGRGGRAAATRRPGGSSPAGRAG
jgi:membrane protein